MLEPSAASQLLAFIEMSRGSETGFNFDSLRQSSGNSSFNELDFRNKLLISEGLVFSPTNEVDHHSFKGFEGSKVAVIPMNGPLLKWNDCGEFGTQSMRRMLLEASYAKSVTTILLQFDSPGGMSSGTQPFADLIREVSKRKHVWGIVDEMACSAAYWMVSATERVFATSNNSMVGSIGTMVRMLNIDKKLENEGIVSREIYATKSTDKNKEFTEAYKGNEGGDKLLIERFIDPANDIFINSVKNFRGDKLSTSEDVFTGKIYYADEAIKIGLVDQISPLEQVYNEAMSMAPKSNQKKYYMSTNTNNAVFQSVLIALNANELPVVEGGFLMTEEQLTALDGKLSEQSTTTRTLSNEVERLTSELEATNVAELQEQLTAAQNAQQEAEGNLATANTKIKEMQAQLESANKGAETFFGGGDHKEDPKPANSGANNEYKVEDQPYIKEAQEKFGHFAKNNEE